MPQRLVDSAGMAVRIEPATASAATRALMILWPAFVMAGVLEMLIFVVVDPDSLQWFGIEPLHWTRTAVYSVTFLIFWLVISTSAAITKLLDEPG
jgi:hypothetical protein